jgi:hypothetical protein
MKTMTVPTRKYITYAPTRYFLRGESNSSIKYISLHK